MNLCGFEVGLDQPLFLIAGPCVIESRDLAAYARRVPEVIGMVVLRPMPGVADQIRE